MSARPSPPTRRMLQKEVFPDLRIAPIHGKMKPKEKDAVMRAFRRA